MVSMSDPPIFCALVCLVGERAEIWLYDSNNMWEMPSALLIEAGIVEGDDFWILVGGDVSGKVAKLEAYPIPDPFPSKPGG